MGGWAPVEINSASAPTPGFKINGTQLLGPVDQDFGGWLGKGGVPWFTGIRLS
jgi:hypothetical protein